MMNVLCFFLGLLVGIVLLSIIYKYSQAKWKAKYEMESTVFHLVEHSKDIIYYYEVKPEQKHRYTSPSVDDFLGEGTLHDLYTNPETPFDMIHPDDYEMMLKKVNGEVDYNQALLQRLRDKEGNYKWFEEHTTPIYENGELVAVQGIMRNIDEKVKMQQDLEYRIAHDTLTSIYNRSYFEQTVAKYNAHINTPIAVVLCDMDELKYINDHFGHKKGDQAIIDTAQFLHHYFDENAIVARVGGDEFGIILVNLAEETVQGICEKLPVELEKYNVQKGVQIKLSIGYAYHKSSVGMLDILYTEADENMYKNKRMKKEQLLIRGR